MGAATWPRPWAGALSERCCRMSTLAPPGEVTPIAELPPLVEGLRSVFRSGRTRSIEWRRAQLGGLAQMIVEHEDRFLAALGADLGKPPFEAWYAENAFTLGEIAFVQAQLDAWVAPEPVPDAPGLPGRSEILRQPYGVVLIIGPWNYPLQLVLLPLVGALAAGNVAVVKPSELAPATSAALAELLPRYVAGAAVVQGGATVTSALLEERFDSIFYTGGGRVGRIVAEAAARHLTPATLELGGKCPAVVARDANLDVAAARLAGAKFFNAGQTCVAPDYVLVERDAEEALLARLVDAVRRFYGDDPRANADFGRIVSEAHTQRLAGLLASGKTVIGGAFDVTGRYVAPTILRDVPPDSPVMSEEIFGPILPVIGVDGVDAAVDFVARRNHPLALYVFSEDPEVCADVLARTVSGGACVNGAMSHIVTPHLPFGGVGPSGMGAYHGRATFETFSHHRSVLWRETENDPASQYPPYAPLALVKQAMGFDG